MENGDRERLNETERRTISNHAKIGELFNLVKGTSINDTGLLGSIVALRGKMDSMEIQMSRIDNRQGQDHDLLINIHRTVRGIGSVVDKRRSNTWAIWLVVLGALASSVAGLIIK